MTTINSDKPLNRLADDDGSGGIGTHLEEYAYLGLETVVARVRPEDGVNLEAFGGTMDGGGDAGDKYVGLDRFGRIAEQQWFNTSTEFVSDDLQYGYDLDGNVSWRDNGADPSIGELYTYDALNRLVSFSRGGLNPDHTAISGSTAASSWTLDANGNWSSVTTNGSTDSRTYNAQNELTSVGDGAMSYDGNGDYVEGGYNFDGLGYDAWRNSITGASTDAPEGSSYNYDALGRRITQQVYGSSVVHLYYDANGNVIEERIGTSTSASVQYVWSPNGVNQLVERDRDTDANGTLDQRLYVQQDANGNVTSLANTSGTIVERYIYDPYGAVTILTGSFGSRSTTSYSWNYLFQGERYDWAVKLYQFGAREYDPTLGRFLQQDPMGYVDGANRYQFAGGNPINRIDPWGTESGWGEGYGDGGSGGGSYGDTGSGAWSSGSYLNPWGGGNSWGGNGMSLDGLSPGWVPGKGYPVYVSPGGYILPNGQPVPDGWPFIRWPSDDPTGIGWVNNPNGTGMYTHPPLPKPGPGYNPGKVTPPAWGKNLGKGGEICLTYAAGKLLGPVGNIFAKTFWQVFNKDYLDPLYEPK